MEVWMVLILIAVITVNILDLSGFMDHVKGWIWKWIFKGKNKPYKEFSLKPFDCSYCMTHHIGLLYLLIAGEWTLPYYALLLIICFLTPNIAGFERWLREAMIKIENLLYKLID